jgi:GNAT superfamily N-acetyltransferase
MKEWRTCGIHVQHLQAVSDGVINHGQNLSREQGGVANPIACTVLDDEILIGGVTGRTEFDRLFINYLWVDAAWRGRTIGTELLPWLWRVAAGMQLLRPSMMAWLTGINVAVTKSLHIFRDTAGRGVVTHF